MGSSSLQLCFNCSASTKLSSRFPLSARSVATKLTSRVTPRWKSISASLNNPEESQQQQQLNLSVLRFTLGIPGFDESYLPRWIGVAFGSLLLLNHFFGSNFVGAAQIRSELLGICLAGFSITVPYLGKYLKGANLVDRAALPEGNRQIFLLSEGLSESLKEDLAWASYVMLKNTNTMSVLISLRDELCVRGYWNTPDDSSKVDLFDQFSMQIQQIGFSQLKEALYFPKCSGAETVDWQMLPLGTLSILIQPVLGATEPNKNTGFIFLASSASYSYNDRDREWIKAVANKFTGYDKASGQEGFQLDCAKAM